MDTVKSWHLHQLQSGHASADNKYLLLGCPIWGTEHTRWFLEYCLPSLMCASNREALDKRGWQLVLYVEGARAQEFRDRLAAYEIPADVRLLPLEFSSLYDQDARIKFAILAAVHNLLIHEAGRCGAGFHMLLPDHVFGVDYVRNLYKLTDRYAAIAQTTLTAMAPAITPMFSAYYGRDHTVLAVPPDKLGAMAWETRTPPWLSWSLDGFEDFSMVPLTDFVYWRTRDSVRMHCAHQNAMWIAPARCRWATAEYGGTIDSELPQYMAGATYVPTAADNLGFIAIATGGPAAPLVPIAEFKAAFVANLGTDRTQDFLNFFMAPCAMPITPDDGFPEAAEVESRFQRFMATIEGS